MDTPPENWHGKPKDEQIASYRARLVFLWIAVGFFALTLFSAGALAFIRPDLLRTLLPVDTAATQTSEALTVELTERALQMTAQANDQQATQNALDLEMTRIAMNNREALLNQTATSFADAAFDSQTAVARQATQIAFDFERTRTALSQAETQTALNFSATQSALNLGNGAPIGTPITLATPVPVLTFEEDFVSGLSAGLWDYDPSHWLIGLDSPLTAAQNNAWLLTRRTDFTDYTLEVEMTPDAPGNYVILLNVDSSALAVQFVSDGINFTRAGLYEVTRADILAGLNLSASTALTETPLSNLSATERLTLKVIVEDSQITVSIGNQTLLDIDLLQQPTRGAIGIQMPQSTFIHRIRVTPDND